MCISFPALPEHQIIRYGRGKKRAHERRHSISNLSVSRRQ